MTALARLLNLAVAVLASAAVAKIHHATIRHDSVHMPPLSDLAESYLYNPAKALNATGSASEPVTCNDVCFGINRTLAVEATNWFCNAFGSMLLKDVDTGYRGTYFYTPDLELWPQSPNGWYEEGQLFLSITVPADGPNGAGGCFATTSISFEACYHNIMNNIDGCNTSRENHKQGGVVRYGCLQYEFQPNPYCAPDCLVAPWYADDAPHTCRSAKTK